MGSPLAGDFSGYDPDLSSFRAILASIFAPSAAQRGRGRARGGLPGGAAPPLNLPAGPDTAAPVVNATDLPGFPGLADLPAASSVPENYQASPQYQANPALDL